MKKSLEHLSSGIFFIVRNIPFKSLFKIYYSNDVIFYFFLIKSIFDEIIKERKQSK